MPLTPDERELFVEIGHHIARVMWRNLSDADPTFRTGMSNNMTSVYKNGCGILIELGVFRRKDGLYYFEMPLEAVRDHLKIVSADLPRDFEEMIGTFLWAAGPYQQDISDEREPFEVPGHMQQAMWAFVKLGYATRQPSGFEWTEKIAPIMIARYLWSKEEGESFTTLDKRKVADLTERIWSAIPVWRRHLLARWIVGKDLIELSGYLSRRWDGERLRLIGRPKGTWVFRPPEFDTAAYQIGKRLVLIRDGHPL